MNALTKIGSSEMIDTRTTVKDATHENRNPDDDFDARVLMSLVLDLDLLDDTVRRVRVQVHALAKNHTVAVPETK